MTFARETTEQIRARAMLEHCLTAFSSLTGRPRRLVARQIRDLARTSPWLGDLIPDDVWDAVYRVQAAGTIAPLLREIP